LIAIKAADMHHEAVMAEGEHFAVDNMIAARHFREMDFGRRLRLAAEQKESTHAVA